MMQKLLSGRWVEIVGPSHYQQRPEVTELSASSELTERMA
jgi:hypothetical protein